MLLLLISLLYSKLNTTSDVLSSAKYGEPGVYIISIFVYKKCYNKLGWFQHLSILELVKMGKEIRLLFIYCLLCHQKSQLSGFRPSQNIFDLLEKPCNVKVLQCPSAQRLSKTKYCT